MDQNTKIEALSQDSVFIKALGDCANIEDAQQLFATKEISISGEALLETCLSLLKCGKKSGALSEDDLLQVAAGTSSRMAQFLSASNVASIAPYKTGASHSNFASLASKKSFPG